MTTLQDCDHPACAPPAATAEALAAVTAESIRLILGTVPRVAGWAEPDADRCISCGHLPGCDCPEFCEPEKAA